MKKKIKIDGKKYCLCNDDTEINSDIRIVILQRGWVMIGRFVRIGNDCELHDASVIRVWGTTEGLGQLANEGEQKNTILDKCNGVVRFDNLTMIASIDCDAKKWAIL